MQSGFKAQGWLGMINGLKYQIDFDKLSFDAAFNQLLREIEAVRAKLGAENNSGKMCHFDSVDLQHSRCPLSLVSTFTMQTQFLTTMDSSSHSSPRPHTWCADDVIEWLVQEKLDM